MQLLGWPSWCIEERVFGPARDHSVTTSHLGLVF